MSCDCRTRKISASWQAETVSQSDRADVESACVGGDSNCRRPLPYCDFKFCGVQRRSHARRVLREGSIVLSTKELAPLWTCLRQSVVVASRVDERPVDDKAEANSIKGRKRSVAVRDHGVHRPTKTKVSSCSSLNARIVHLLDCRQ